MLSFAPPVKRYFFAFATAICLLSFCSAAHGQSAVIFRNRVWDLVLVEIRLGSGGNPPPRMAPGGTARMRRNTSQSFETGGQDVWYRREADPIRHTQDTNHEPKWGPWIHQSIFPNRPPLTIEL